MSGENWTMDLAKMMGAAYANPHAAMNVGIAQWRDLSRSLWAPWLNEAPVREEVGGKRRTLKSEAKGAPKRMGRLFMPDTAGPGAPLVVMLHGCMQDAESFAKLTRMDEIARREGFFVLYPDQETSANPMQCWNWNSAENQSRMGGEPEALADLIRQSQAICETPVARTRMAGISAGGALAATMACLYPEVLGSVAVVAGPAPFAARSLSEAMDTMERGPDAAADLRAKARALEAGVQSAVPKRLPMLIVQGQADDTVNPKHGAAQERAALALNDALDDGRIDGSTKQTLTKSECESGRTRTWRDSKGQVIAVVVEPAFLGHAWSGGDLSEPFAQKGFDQSRLALDFFEAAESGVWSSFAPKALSEKLWGKRDARKNNSGRDPDRRRSEQGSKK